MPPACWVRGLLYVAESASVRYTSCVKQRKTLFVSVNLTEEARDALRQATLDLSAHERRRLSMSDTLIQAVAELYSNKLNNNDTPS